MAQHLPPDAPVASLTDCAHIRMHLDAFVDGELTAFDGHDHPLTELVGAHVRVCEPCARLERQLQALRAALRALARREQTTACASDALRRRAAQILASR
ncbi:hypothetical protein [Gemmatimonas groenlandica]|uniref:Zinc-finger domain-containing protein n=1 Tax=Gemmatimonas groenlandica TaxID=2732249 RepID=A0A6M4IK52_9BACT|nr:hypothetical protein [Gemmatimonas groenlandica]QJR34239.1 hypothetical protein HKW67_01255 [Gemmatimonas groenlandica]